MIRSGLYRDIQFFPPNKSHHTKHINTLCGQNVELLSVKLAVHIVTNGLSYLPGSLHYKYRERARR